VIVIRSLLRRISRTRIAIQFGLALGAGLIGGGSSLAANVSGTLVAYEGQTPEPGQPLHFQNRITADIFMATSSSDGSFMANLPPGAYDLRSEHGAVLAGPIYVGPSEISLGRVSDPAPYAPERLFTLQSVAPSILDSPAPSTANIMTRDTTPVPPNAPLENATAMGIAPIYTNTPLQPPAIAPTPTNAQTIESAPQSAPMANSIQP
jgi:hypothetical protein